MKKATTEKMKMIMKLEDIIMKKSKRFAALLTAGLLALAPCAMASMSLTAFASTLTVTDTDPAEHTYNAYQLITGTKDADGNLSDMNWGDAITDDGAALIAALNAKKSDLGIDELASNATVNQVAAQLAKIKDADNIQLLAKVFNETGVLTKTAAKPLAKSGTKYTNTELADGWYLILDESDPLVSGETAGVKVRSANLLKIVEDTEAVAKHSLPSVEKKIVEGTQKVDANSASIGDTVNYEIKTKSPDVTGYDKYYFVLNDTLSKGLTYDDTLTVTLGGSPLTLDEDGTGTDKNGQYYLVQGTYSATTGTTLKIVFKDCVDLFKDVDPGTDIVVTYKATLNENAVITDAGNPNTVNLQYSNDPNADTDSTNTTDEPKDSEPTGKTPDDEVKTYTTALKLMKKDNKGTPLAGAAFRLTGNGVNKVITVGKCFVKADDGSYFKLKDGTYTEDGSGDAALYESTTQKYKLEEQATITQNTTEGSEVYVEAFVDANGVLTFTGLGDGDYTITEIVVPEGYQEASDVTIKIASAPTLDGPNWTVTKDSTTPLTANTAYQYEFEVQNIQKSNLPTTGGIGTKLFYLLGGMLAVGSGIVLVTKKRMSDAEK